MNYSNSKISECRNKILLKLRKFDFDNTIFGGRVSKKDYLKELCQSFLTISPFGYGEICYRDFEAIISRSLLLKPDMAHIETYPNFFINNVTYVPFKWGLEDLRYVIENCLNNKVKYK